jgi:hypothetical protein
MSMRLLPLIALLSFGLSSPAMAQIKVATLDDRVKSLDAKTLTTADCLAQIAKASSSNGPGLMYGARLCAVVKKPLESSFLLLAGQLRAMSDILLMPPATQSDDRSLMPLYGALWAGGGMAGIDDDILHDPAERARFFQMLDAWAPAYGPDYDPGWSVRKRPDAAKYAATMAQAKADMRKNLDRVVRLDSDDRYYALQRQYNAILARIPRSGGMAPGTADYKLFKDLGKRMRERGIALGVEMGPPPPDFTDPASVKAEAAKAAARSPPASPEKGEAVVSASVDPVVEKCTDQAERMAVAGGGKVARTLITSSAKWGIVVRPDIVGGEMGPERFTCTDHFTGTRPFEVDKLEPLQEQKTAVVP